jgi:hypothetical protein
MQRMKIRGFFFVLAALSIAVTTACGGSSINPGDLSVAGTYQLRLYNQQALPYVSETPQGSITVAKGTLTVTDDGAWNYSLITKTVANGATTTDTTADAGTYTRSGSSLTFRSSSSNQTVFSGTWASYSFKLQGADGNAYVFIV